jgi:hypothetical protein
MLLGETDKLHLFGFVFLGLQVKSLTRKTGGKNQVKSSMFVTAFRTWGLVSMKNPKVLYQAPWC